MDRPIAWVAMGLVAGMWSAAHGGAALTGAMLLLFALFAVALLLRHSCRIHFGISVAFFAAGALVWSLTHVRMGEDSLSALIQQQSAAEMTLEGTVRQAPLHLPKTEYAHFVLEVDHAALPGGAAALSGRTLVLWTEPEFGLHHGERVRLKGAPRLRLGPVNHGLRGYEDWLRTQGMHSEIRIRGNAVEKLGAAWWSPWYWGSRLRQWEADVFQRCVPADVVPFVLTVWLGESGQISNEENEAFIASGTAHVLSVSGVHVSILFITLQFVLRNAGSRRTRTVLMMIAVAVFAVATGGRVATLRAALMIELHLAAGLLNREADSPTTLSIAALVFLLVNPDWLFDAGFLLSFSSVASLLLFAPEIERLMGFSPMWARHAFAPTLAVQLLPLPIALHFFHVLPLLSPLANLIIIPLLSIVLWLAFGTVVAAVVLGYAAILIGHALAPVVWSINGLVRQTLHVPHAYETLTSPSSAAVLAYYAAVAAFYVFCRDPAQRKRSGAVMLAACAAMVLLWSPLSSESFVEFLDVGHGDSTFIRTPGGANVLVDGGDASEYGDTGTRVILPYLYTQGVKKLDLLVVSHADRDHLGGLLEVVRRMEVKQVLMGPEGAEPLVRQFLVRCQAAGVPVRRAFQGEDFRIGGAEIEVLHPPSGWRPDLSENEHSLVLRVSWPGMRVLMAGDIEREAEKLLASGDCGATVLKIPHHGSDTSSTAAFVQRVSPEVAVMSVLPRGNFHTAAPQVIARYERQGVQVYRTDEHGGVRVTAAPGGLSISTARSDRGWNGE